MRGPDRNIWGFSQLAAAANVLRSLAEYSNAGPLQRKIEGADLRDAKAVILHMGDVSFVDQSGVYALGDLASDLQHRGIEAFIADLQDEPKELLAKLGVAPGIIPANRRVSRINAVFGELRCSGRVQSPIMGTMSTNPETP